LTRLEIYINVYEFRNSIAKFKVQRILQGWMELEGGYLAKEFGRYAVVVESTFPKDRLKELEELDIGSFHEVLWKPGNFRNILPLQIAESYVETSYELCLQPFPGMDLINNVARDNFELRIKDCCVSIRVNETNIKSGLKLILNAFRLYYKIIEAQEETALSIAQKSLQL